MERPAYSIAQSINDVRCEPEELLAVREPPDWGQGNIGHHSWRTSCAKQHCRLPPTGQHRTVLRYGQRRKSARGQMAKGPATVPVGQPTVLEQVIKPATSQRDVFGQ